MASATVTSRTLGFLQLGSEQLAVRTRPSDSESTGELLRYLRFKFKLRFNFKLPTPVTDSDKHSGGY